jgi:hypothetical protein
MPTAVIWIHCGLGTEPTGTVLVRPIRTPTATKVARTARPRIERQETKAAVDSPSSPARRARIPRVP